MRIVTNWQLAVELAEQSVGLPVEPDAAHVAIEAERRSWRILGPSPSTLRGPSIYADGSVVL